MAKIKVKRGYKVELDPTKAQRRAFRQHAGAARFAWNWGLSRRLEEYAATGRSSNAIEQHRQLNALKRTDFPWMYEVSKCAPQEALRDLDRAFAHFYRRLELKRQGKYKGKVGEPKFKSRKRGKGSFRLTGSIKVEEGRIRLPRLGWIRLKEQGYIPTQGVNILSATVSERARRWFVSVQVEEEIAVEPATGPAVGVDLGVSVLATCSNGETFENPKSLRRYERKLKRLQRKLARQQRGSRNRERTRQEIARLHYRIACIRRDALHKATSAIVAKTKPPEERPAVVVIEDLNVSGMMQNHRLAGAIADASLYEFRGQLTYKAAWYGVELQTADPFYPSSKVCSACGHKKPRLELSERVFVCEHCGSVQDRDLNASHNLAHLAGLSGKGTHTGSSPEIDACGEERLQILGVALGEAEGPVLLEEAGTRCG